jgi:hypothetical protein
MGLGFALLLGIGMVLVIEGLVFALLPGRLEDMLRMLAEIPVETRRILGLSAMTLGVIVVSLVLGTA